mmetsp:Transcript_63310/g.112451  ORF Transcript_63310/g.112451 Transcript_63310/m.112451 type:complete len:266 (-) Transcript_63310:1193-1990(-)
MLMEENLGAGRLSSKRPGTEGRFESSSSSSLPPPTMTRQRPRTSRQPPRAGCKFNRFTSVLQGNTTKGFGTRVCQIACSFEPSLASVACISDHGMPFNCTGFPWVIFRSSMTWPTLTLAGARNVRMQGRLPKSGPSRGSTADMPIVSCPFTAASIQPGSTAALLKILPLDPSLWNFGGRPAPGTRFRPSGPCRTVTETSLRSTLRKRNTNGRIRFLSHLVRNSAVSAPFHVHVGRSTFSLGRCNPMSQSPGFTPAASHLLFFVTA